MRKSIFCIFVLALLTLVGCDEKHDSYYVLYVYGTVVDEAGEPIQGIRAYPEGGSFAGREGYTNYLGEFGGYTHLAPRNRWVIHFEDVDGEHNRGEYESLSVDITAKVTPPGRPDEWGYTGSCMVQLGNIVLKQKM